MNQAKADFFDRQAAADWAAAEYGAEEAPKVERIIQEGLLEAGQRVLEPGCGGGPFEPGIGPGGGPVGLGAGFGH